MLTQTALATPDKLNLWKIWVCVHLWGQKIWQRSLISLFLELQLGTSICDPTAMCLTYSWDETSCKSHYCKLSMYY